MSRPTSGAPLAGLRVLELTQFFAGPVCGRLLAGLGADVTKVEPIGGERTRHMSPFADGHSVAYLFANAGKRILELDLSRSEGRGELLALVDSSDVFIENLTAGALNRLGVPEEPQGPRMRHGIRCSIRGSAPNSAAAQGQRDVDVTIQALSGMAWVAGDRSGPRRVPIPVVDVTTAAFAALAVLGRLVNVGPDPGWCLYVSMLSSAAFIQGPLLLAEALGISVPQLGGENLFVAPNGCYKASDGFVALAAVDDAAWRRLCAALGIPEIEGHRYATTSDRLQSRERVRALVEAATADRTVEATTALLSAAGIPSAPVRTYRDAIDHPEIHGMIVVDPSRPSASYVKTPLETLFDQ